KFEPVPVARSSTRIERALCAPWHTARSNSCNSDSDSDAASRADRSAGSRRASQFASESATCCNSLEYPSHFIEGNVPRRQKVTDAARACGQPLAFASIEHARQSLGQCVGISGGHEH